jgi:transposase-like protein
LLGCRRCSSFKLVQLDKKSPQDNDVFRCQECGFLFSPSSSTEEDSRPGAGPDSVSPAGLPRLGELCRGQE